MTIFFCFLFFIIFLSEELESFLIEITAIILRKEDDQPPLADNNNDDNDKDKDKDDTSSDDNAEDDIRYVSQLLFTVFDDTLYCILF